MIARRPIGQAHGTSPLAIDATRLRFFAKAIDETEALAQGERGIPLGGGLPTIPEPDCVSGRAALCPGGLTGF